MRFRNIFIERIMGYGLALSLLTTDQLFADSSDTLFNGKKLYADVQHYVSLGIHRTGTDGDNKTSEWIKGILEKNGFETKYVPFELEQYFPENVSVAVNGRLLEAFPVWPVSVPVAKLDGELADVANGLEKLSGKIVRINQTSKERSFSFMDKDNASIIKKVIEAGAKAVILIADNAASEIAAINSSPGDHWPVPVVQLAPKDAKYLSAGSKAQLSISGKLKKVTARNVQGTIGSGNKTVIISTPISGWFTCGGERGPGVAVFNALAKWVAEKKRPYRFIFTGNSGHELAQHYGTHIFLHEQAPMPENVRLWFHLGASFATFAYKKTEEGIQKQPAADASRIIYFQGELKNSIDKAFEGVKINQAKDKAYGELVVAQQEGYSNFAGLVGTASFPLFHTQYDDASTTSPELLEEMANAVKRFIEIELQKN